MIVQWHAAFWRYQMVIFGNNSKQWHVDPAKINKFAPNLHLIFDQQVLLVNVPDPLPEGFASNWWCVIQPSFYTHKVFNKILVVCMLYKFNVLVNTLLEGFQYSKAKIHELRRDVSEVINQEIGIDVLRQIT